MLASLRKPREEIPYENRKNLAPGLKGYYVHRLLVNAVAMWASPKLYFWSGNNFLSIGAVA